MLGIRIWPLNLLPTCCGLLPVLLNFDILVWLVLDELLGPLFDNLGRHKRPEGNHDPAKERAVTLQIAQRKKIVSLFWQLVRYNPSFIFPVAVIKKKKRHKNKSKTEKSSLRRNRFLLACSSRVLHSGKPGHQELGAAGCVSQFFFSMAKVQDPIQRIAPPALWRFPTSVQSV